MINEMLLYNPMSSKTHITYSHNHNYSSIRLLATLLHNATISTDYNPEILFALGFNKLMCFPLRIFRRLWNFVKIFSTFIAKSQMNQAQQHPDICILLAQHAVVLGPSFCHDNDVVAMTYATRLKLNLSINVRPLLTCQIDTSNGNHASPRTIIEPSGWQGTTPPPLDLSLSFQIQPCHSGHGSLHQDHSKCHSYHGLCHPDLG